MGKPNTDKSFQASSMILKYLRDEITETESIELEVWKQTGSDKQRLFESLANPRELEKQLEEFGKTNTESGWQRIQDKLADKKKEERKDHSRKIWWRAAAAIFILGLATWQIWVHDFNKQVADGNTASQYGQDVQPGTFNAQLILSDGSKVNLSNQNDTSFTENGSLVQRTSDGTIKYGKGGSGDGEIAWNTLRVPNAGEYLVILEDGSRVWLNAATTLRYPVQFAGKERRVELLSGEAYFEIKKDNEKPFIVVANQMEVLAVGTAFNVNSYLAEAGSISATLAEGKVRVSAKDAIRFLSPGEQVVLYRDHDNRIEVSEVDLEVVLAWKNGLFVFKGTPLPDVMQQLARWYDVDIEYDKAFKEKKNFTGEIRRNVPVSKLLQMMEMTGIARFRIIDNTVVVMPFNP